MTPAQLAALKEKAEKALSATSDDTDYTFKTHVDPSFVEAVGPGQVLALIARVEELEGAVAWAAKFITEVHEGEGYYNERWTAETVLERARKE
jgi:hypothetical protein